MYRSRLFLGFVMNPLFQSALKEVPNPSLVDIFINNDDYLHKIEHDDDHLIGKYLQQNTQLHQLYLLESNIKSIVKSKLIPYYDFKLNPVRVFSIQS
jgi:hypothetical protein